LSFHINCMINSAKHRRCYTARPPSHGRQGLGRRLGARGRRPWSSRPLRPAPLELRHGEGAARRWAWRGAMAGRRPWQGGGGHRPRRHVSARRVSRTAVHGAMAIPWRRRRARAPEGGQRCAPWLRRARFRHPPLSLRPAVLPASLCPPARPAALPASLCPRWRREAEAPRRRRSGARAGWARGPASSRPFRGPPIPPLAVGDPEPSPSIGNARKDAAAALFPVY